MQRLETLLETLKHSQTLIEDGLRRMIEKQEDVFYYITLMNENYAHPEMPAGAEDGIIRGRFRDSSTWGASGACSRAPRGRW